MKNGGSMKQTGMPNEGSAKGGAKSAPNPSNTGATGGLRQEAGTNQGATAKPTTTNRFPNGLA